MTEEYTSTLINGGECSTVKVVSAIETDKYAGKVGDIVVNAGNQEIVIKVYKRRWLMLSLYIIFAALVGGQWIEYSIIANIISRYYNVSAFWVDSTSMIFMLFYAIFVFPATYLTERIGLRWTIILASALCSVGSWIKVLSVAPGRFFVTMLGQAVIALAVVTVVTMPGRVAAKWFASNELSTATSLGIFGPLFGISVSFLLPPVIVKNHENLADIGTDLSLMFMCVAVAATVNLVLVGLLFQDEPKLPPNKTRALQKSNRDEDKDKFTKSMKRLFTNQSFLILCNSYGINIGIFNAISTMLNQFFLMHFENGEEDAGRIGFLIIFAGMIGSIFFGIILDKMHKFKYTTQPKVAYMIDSTELLTIVSQPLIMILLRFLMQLIGHLRLNTMILLIFQLLRKAITVIVYFLTLCGQILFAIAMLMEFKWMVYAASTFLGFFMTGYMVLGYEMAIEYTYPESETNSSGILNVTNNIYGIVLVLIMEEVLKHYGEVPVHVIFCVALLAGLIMTVMTKDEHRRQDMLKATTSYVSVPQMEANNKSKDSSV